MKMALVLAALATAVLSTAHADVDAAQLQITEVRVRELPDFQNLSLAEVKAGIGSVDCATADMHVFSTAPQAPTQDTGDIMDPLNTVEMVVDKIINIGKKIWNIVQAGKPVSNIKTDVATALPMGAKCWTDLGNWQMPQSKVYQASFVNGWGSEVVKISYRVLWLPGGQVNGVGNYIGYATITPVNVEVSWGFTLNATVSIPTVFNMGSKTAPVGGMQMTMQYRVESALTTIDQAQAFFVDGRGNFKMLQ
jgi:hypothetical protein